MKSAVLPAQITTVEDKITANLSLNQVVLLIMPVVLSAVIYFALPPFSRLAIYKAVISGLIIVIFSVLAYRVNNKIILQWLITRACYYRRPRIYVYQKNENPGYLQIEADPDLTTKPEQTIINDPLPLTVKSDLLKELCQIHTKDDLRVVFKPNRQGGLNVSVDRA